MIIMNIYYNQSQLASLIKKNMYIMKNTTYNIYNCYVLQSHLGLSWKQAWFHRVYNL